MLTSGRYLLSARSRISGTFVTVIVHSAQS